MLGIMGRGLRELRSFMAWSWVTVLLLLELSPIHGTRSVNKRWLFCCYRSAIDLTFCDLVCLRVWNLVDLSNILPEIFAPKPCKMSEEGAEAVAPAQDQNQGFFTGNIMNFERPKFDSRRENRLEALKAFKKKCGYIFKGSLAWPWRSKDLRQRGLVWRWGCKRLWSDVD